MREIVTVQVGGYANFVGSHFWNFQDELLGLVDDPDSDPAFLNHQQYINMDVLFRTGETQKGVPTYTPRLVSIDLQGSLGSLSSRGSLYNEDLSSSSAVPTWSGSVVTSTSEVHQRNLFLQSLYQEPRRKSDNKQGEISDKDIVESLENSVQFWTDFLKVHYHPRSLYELSGLWVNSLEFDNYGIGKDVYSEGLRGEEISEKLRFFTEESDHIQGFQFIADDSGGFSALSADLLEHIADDYPYIPILLYTVRAPSSPTNRKQTVSRNIHDAVSFSRLSSLSRLIVPLGLPSLSTSKACKSLHVKDEKAYHTSAVYAAAIHSISLPLRMDTLGPTAGSSYASGAMDVNGVIQMLAGQARQNLVAILDTAMPAPALTGNEVQPSFLANLESLTSEISDDAEDLHAVESMVVHGALGSGNHRASVTEVTDAIDAAYKMLSTRPMFSHLSTARCPLPIPLPFPSIFRPLIGTQGELLTNSTGPSCSSSLEVHSVPMAARLRSSTAILPYLENRLANLRKLGITRGAPGGEIVRSWGFGKDELEDMEQNLSKMVVKLTDANSQSEDESD